MKKSGELMQAIQIVFKNIAQVLLLDNPITGAFILVGLFVGNWKVGLMALVASIISLLLAKYMNYSEEEISAGLAGFNPVLTAVALSIFLVPKWYSIVIILIAIIMTLPIGSALSTFLKPYRVPMLTIPFIVMTWMILLMTYEFKFVKSDVSILPKTLPGIKFPGDHIHWLNAFLSGFSEIFLLKTVIGGALILIGIFVASRKAGIFAILANIIGFTAVLVLGGNHDQINDGLFGYNVILTALALGVTFNNQMIRYLSIVLGIVLTIIIHASSTTLLMPYGLPVLTLPFVLSTWVMLFAGKNMKEQ